MLGRIFDKSEDKRIRRIRGEIVHNSEDEILLGCVLRPSTRKLNTNKHFEVFGSLPAVAPGSVAPAVAVAVPVEGR